MVKLTHEEILRYEEFLRLARLAVELGMRKLRITGGEPLIRRGVEQFLQNLTRIAGVQEICLTTNGVLLSEKAEALWSAGIRRLNISLDTLKAGRYRQLTGADYFSEVMEAIRRAEQVGFYPIKINCVVMKGLNDDEILDFARLTWEKPYHVRFIEFMPIGQQTRWTEDYYLPIASIRSRIQSLGELEDIPAEPTAGPAQRCRLKGAAGELGFISPISRHFCCTCNRLRLTADGRLRPCLFGDAEVDIKTPMRQGASDLELLELFHQALRSKPRQHPSDLQELANSPRAMVSIGG
jgi:GTP 3',8-cyclase